MAKDEHKLTSLDKKWLKFDVIIIDELGESYRFRQSMKQNEEG
ncbi:hypothetical protein ACERII_17825 [Evansella sp. AB-rgal1]